MGENNPETLRRESQLQVSLTFSLSIIKLNRYLANYITTNNGYHKDREIEKIYRSYKPSEG